MQQDVQIQSHQHLVQQQHQMAVAQLRHQQQVQKQPEQQQQQLQQLIQQEAEVWIAKEQQKRATLPGSAGGLIYTSYVPPPQSHKVHTCYSKQCSSRFF